MTSPQRFRLCVVTSTLVMGTTLTAEARGTCPVSRAVVRFEDGRVFRADGFGERTVRTEQFDECRPRCMYGVSAVRGSIAGRWVYIWTESIPQMSGGNWYVSWQTLKPRTKSGPLRLDWSARPPSADFLDAVVIHEAGNWQVKKVTCARG